MASYESGLRLGARQARRRLAAERPADDERLRELFRRDVAALRFGSDDRLANVLEWLAIEYHEPMQVGVPGARVFVLGGVRDDKRPSMEEARRFVEEGHTLITSAGSVDFAAEIAPALAPAKRNEGWSKPASGDGWSKAEPSAPASAGPAAVAAPRLTWATGALEPAWVDCEHTFGGEPWVTRGGKAIVASVGLGAGQLVHLGGALLSWSTPAKSEAVDPAALGLDDPDHDGSPVDERAYRIGLTAGALLLELVLEDTAPRA